MLGSDVEQMANTAFLQSQSNIWNSFLIWNILTQLVVIQLILYRGQGEPGSLSGEKNPLKGGVQLPWRKQILPSRSKCQLACICSTLLCVSCLLNSSSHLMCHWHLTVIPPGRLDYCPWARENTEALREIKCSAHTFSKRKAEQGMWVSNFRLRTEIWRKVLEFSKDCSLKDHGVWDKKGRDAVLQEFYLLWCQTRSHNRPIQTQPFWKNMTNTWKLENK